MFFRITISVTMLSFYLCYAEEIDGKEENSMKAHAKYIYEREQKNTQTPQKLSREELQRGFNNAKTQEEIDNSNNIVIRKAYKSHLYLAIQAGVTFSAVDSNINSLPTLSVNVGYQNFLGILSHQLGFRIFVDSLIATNALKSLKTSAFDDFVDTTFSFVGVGTALLYEVPINGRWNYGISAGYGIGYMTYEDLFWDSLNGFSTNISLTNYFSYKERYKIELGFKTFFYHYGIYVQRKLGNITTLIESSNFARPVSIVMGFHYVF